MDYEAFGIIGSVMRVLGTLTALGVAGVAAGVAIYCTKKKLRPVAAWLLALSWGGMFFMFVVAAIMDYAFLPRFGWEIMSYFHIGSELIFLVLGILMALSIGMFRPLQKIEAVGREVGHGA